MNVVGVGGKGEANEWWLTNTPESRQVTKWCASVQLAKFGRNIVAVTFPIMGASRFRPIVSGISSIDQPTISPAMDDPMDQHPFDIHPGTDKASNAPEPSKRRHAYMFADPSPKLKGAHPLGQH